MEGEHGKQVLAPVQQRCERGGDESGGEAHAERRNRRPRQGGVRHDGEQRTGTEQRDAEDSCDRRCGRHGNEAPRLPLEQQQLQREQDRRHRCREDGRHATGRTGHEERLAFRRRQVQRLAEQRPERAPRDNDRPLGAVRTAGADREGRRQGLEHGDLGIHPAAADQDRLERFGNAVAADPLRAVPCHQPDDQPTAHGDERAPGAQRTRRRRRERGRQPVEVGEVREQADQTDQGEGDEGAGHADECRHGSEEDEPGVGGIVAETVVGGGALDHDGVAAM